MSLNTSMRVSQQNDVVHHVQCSPQSRERLLCLSFYRYNNQRELKEFSIRKAGSKFLNFEKITVYFIERTIV